MMRRRLVAAAWLLMVSILYLFENNTGTRAVLIASWVVLIASYLAAWFSARRLTCELHAPTECRQGETLIVTVTSRGRLPLAMVKMQLVCRNSFTGEQAEHSLFAPAGTCRMEITPEHAGMLELCVQCSAMDLLGLPMKQHAAEQTAVLLVRPVLEPAAAEPALLNDQPGEHSANHTYAQQPGAEVREYQPGDPVRSIHWKLSQRSGKLLIRLPEEQPEGTLQLVLDAAGLSPDDAAQLDRLACRYLSQSMGLLQAGRPHCALWLDRDGQLQTVSISTANDAETLMVTLYAVGVSLEFAPDVVGKAAACSIK